VRLTGPITDRPAVTLSNLAGVLQDLGDPAAADPLLKRARRMREGGDVDPASCVRSARPVAPFGRGPSGDGGMHVEERVAFLQAELDRQHQRFTRRRRRDKRKSFALQMATVALSATITVLR
jgi:hypothetical protein